MWAIDNSKTNNIIKTVSEKVQVLEIDTDDAQIVENEDEKNSAYFEYIKDFTEEIDIYGEWDNRAMEYIKELQG